MKSEWELKQAVSQRDGLKCRITGQAVADSSKLNLLKIKNEDIHVHDDDGIEIFNPADYILIHNDFFTHSTLGASIRHRTLESELKTRIKEIDDIEKINYEKHRKYREQLEQQRQEADTLRDKLISDQKERERQLNNEAENLSEDFRKKEQALLDTINADHLLLQQQANKIEEEKKNLELLTLEHKNTLSSEYAKLEREKEKYKEETRKNIERRSSEYVNESIISLESSAKKYHTISRNWSVAGMISLIFGVATGIFFGVKGLSPAEGKDIVEWSQVVFFAFKGVIVIGLFVALAKYCFMYGQSFMHESIKNGERKHAINFGKFYLQSYGVDAEWSQIKEAFEHWNINSASAFSGHDPDKFDPKMMDKALQFAESFQKLAKSKKPSSDTEN